jgi:branched-chain amino acid transport system permease protein
VPANLIMFFEFSAIYILLTWAFYIPVKGGRISNSPVYIFGITSYLSAFIMKDLGWSYISIFFISICAGALVGLFTALAFSRTRGFTLGIATIAMIFVVQNVIRNTPAVGGTSGFPNIPAVSNLLLIAWITVLVIGVIIYRIDHSRLGRAIEVMREHLDIAGTVGGVYPLKMDIFLQTSAGVITGAAGAIYPFVLRAIYPESFGFNILLYIWTILFIGGSYTMWGTLFFAPFFWGLNQIIPQAFVNYVPFIFGGLLILILVLRPEGALDRRLIGNIRRLFSRKDGRAEFQLNSDLTGHTKV